MALLPGSLSLDAASPNLCEAIPNLDLISLALPATAISLRPDIAGVSAASPSMLFMDIAKFIAPLPVSIEPLPLVNWFIPVLNCLITDWKALGSMNAFIPPICFKSTSSNLFLALTTLCFCIMDTSFFWVICILASLVTTSWFFSFSEIKSPSTLSVPNESETSCRLKNCIS